MAIFQILSLILVLSAVFAYINYRYLRLPTTIGVMALGMLLSLALIILGELGLKELRQWAEQTLHRIDFNETVLHGLLAFLLFAGALHINLGDLGSQKWPILLLSTVGVVVSTFLIGGVMFYVLNAVGLTTPLIYCLLFGALISPTDPIAVLGILKSAKVPKSLEIKIAGESLFNDGIGVVVFLALLQGVSGHQEVTTAGIARLFLEEAVGGIALGLLAGYIAYRMLRKVDHYQTEVLITLAVAAGTYALADALHALHWLNLSGPLAVVAAGLLIGNQGRTLAMSATTVEHLDTFWELVDEVLNAALFVLIGLELIIIPFTTNLLVAGVLAVPVVLLARFISVGGMVRLMAIRRTFTRGSIPILTWSGLRGGISVALALSLPAGPYRNTLLTITYFVVIFSILVQGLTVARVVRRSLGPQSTPA
jgi:CPA1 family monovalent cation:H+ antiporter